MKPGSPEWCRRVSPSKAAAILGHSPWDSPRAIYHKMRGDVPWDEETEAMERGNLLESGVLAWWRKRHPEHGEWAEQVTYTLGDWCVATPDAVTTLDGATVIVEAKTSSDMDEWGDSGTDAVPTHYLTQAYLAAHVANRCGVPVSVVHMPVLGPRLRFSNYLIPHDPEVGELLEKRLRAFYESLSADEPPPLDDTVATYQAMRKVHPQIDAGQTAELDPALAGEFVAAALDADAAEARARLARSRVLEAVGRAQWVECGGVRVARRQANATGVALVRTTRQTTFEGVPA